MAIFYLIFVMFLELGFSICIRIQTWSELESLLVWPNSNTTAVNTCEEIVSEGQTINLIVTDNYPFVKYEKQEIIGFAADVWKILEEHLKFKTVIREWNFKPESAIFNATKFDVLLNPVDLNTMFLDHYDHTMPITTIWYHIYAKVESDSGNANFYFIIWNRSVRAFYYVTIIILALFFNKVINIWQKRGYSCKDSSVTCSLMHVFATVNNQGNQVNVTKTSMRVIVLSAALFGYFMSVSYSAMLTSKLTTKGIIYPEISLDLVRKNQYALCVPVSSYAYWRFSNMSTNKVYDDWSSVVNRYPCSTTTKSTSVAWLPPQDFCQDYAVAIEMNSVYNNPLLHNQPDCKTFRSNKRYFYTDLALITRKGFPLRKQLSKSLLKFHTYGIISKIKHAWIPNQVHRSKIEYQVTFRHIRPVLELYGLVVIISAGAFVLELLTYRRKTFNCFDKWTMKA